MMTYSVPRTSAVALGVAAFVSLSALSAARADSSAEPGAHAKRNRACPSDKCADARAYECGRAVTQ